MQRSSSAGLARSPSLRFPKSPESVAQPLDIPGCLDFVANTWKASSASGEGIEVYCPDGLLLPDAELSFSVCPEKGAISGEEVLIHRIFTHSRQFAGYVGVGYVARDGVSQCMLCGDYWGVEPEALFRSPQRRASSLNATRKRSVRGSLTVYGQEQVHCRACGALVCRAKCLSAVPAIIDELRLLGPQPVCKKCYWGSVGSVQKTVSAQRSCVRGMCVATATHSHSPPLSIHLAICEPAAEGRLLMTTVRRLQPIHELTSHASDASLASSSAKRVDASLELVPSLLRTHRLLPKQMSGFLRKLQSTWHLWQRRYFVLEEGWLHHYKARSTLNMMTAKKHVYRPADSDKLEDESKSPDSSPSTPSTAKRTLKSAPSLFHLSEVDLERAYHLRCTYNVLKFKLVANSPADLLIDLVAISPSKAHSKSQVVLHLRANSMQEKASWLDSFTAHSLFMMQQDFQG